MQNELPKNLFFFFLFFAVSLQSVFGEIVVTRPSAAQEDRTLITPAAGVDRLSAKEEEPNGVLTPTPREVYYTDENTSEKIYPRYVLNQNSVIILAPPENSPLKNSGQNETSLGGSRKVLEKNRDRARMYANRNGDHVAHAEKVVMPNEMTTGVMGKDGVAVFPCNSVGGGRYFLINLGGKSTKARCR